MTEAENPEQLAQHLFEQYHAFWNCLSIKERSVLKDFMNSPFHKCNQQVLKLAEFLNASFKNNKIVDLKNETLIRKYSSGLMADSLPLHWSKFVQQLSTLLDLIERFLVYQQAIGDKLVYQRLLVKSLKERKNNDLFLKAAADFRTSLNKTPLTIMVAADKWWLEHQCYYDKYTNHSTTQGFFDRNIAAFNTFSQVTTLRNYLELLNRNVSDEAVIEQYNLAFESILAKQVKPPTLIKLYSTLIKILKGKEELPGPNYLDFKNIFSKQSMK